MPSPALIPRAKRTCTRWPRTWVTSPSNTPRLAELLPGTSRLWSLPSNQPGEKPRERQLHLLDLPRRELDRPARQRRVDRFAVVPSDVGHVLGGLQAAFDLQRRDARVDQLGNQVERGQVLRAQQVLDLSQLHVPAVADQIERQAARLGTLPPVRDCGLRAIRWSGIGPSTPRTALRGQRPPAAHAFGCGSRGFRRSTARGPARCVPRPAARPR